MDEEKLLRRRKRAQRDNNEAVLISTCTDLANLYEENGQYDSAIEEYSLLAAIYDKQNKRLEYAKIARGIGEAYLGLRNFGQALNHLKVYYEIAKELNNKLEEQRALATIGHTYLTNYLDGTLKDKNHLFSANKFFMKSLKVCESLNGEVSKVEAADMSARLFANLGLVQDCMGNVDKAAELINKSITLCKSNDLYEQLQRAYISLGSLFEKQGENKMALHQYNLAIETAKKLRDKPLILAMALVSKSEVLIKLGDFHGAKGTLLKAYKLKISNVKERHNIESNLRVVASMCKKEDQILTTRDTDYQTLKTLYEKMGDCACELKNFAKGLDYYKKMLVCAENAGLSDEEMAKCYYSVAETYKDNNQYEAAVDYFEKELQLCRLLKDKLNTLSKIADTKESADCPVTEVQTVYNKAIDSCKEEGNRHEEGRMLKRFIRYLRRQMQHSEAHKLQQELNKLNYNSSDSDGETSDAQSGSVVGGDINLDEITDVSEDSDLDSFGSPRARRRSKKFMVKRNMRGETQLHTACIQNKVNVVRHLLEQGHPVNVRDNCGWLPLHEACNHGHLEIVRLLLEKGAAINDRGGMSCEGFTPLHDAATNGHLEIVELLLSKGANPLAKTDSGDTVLSCLTKWRQGQPLSDDAEALYESIIAQITQALEKAAQNNEEHSIEVLDGRETRRSLSFEDSRRSTTIGLEQERALDTTKNFAKDYKSVMQNLRHRRDKQSPKKSAPSAVSKRPALIAAEERVDDWLENDLVGKSHKKRKTNSPLPRSETACSSKSASSRRSSTHVIDSDDDFQMDFDDDPTPENTYYELRDAPSTSKNYQSPTKSTNVSSTVKKRKHQAKLTSFGHTRSFMEADSTSSPVTTKKSNSESHRVLPRSASFDNPQPPADPMLSVDVRINGKLYRVPVLTSQLNTCTIKWLANEAAARCARKEYMIPTLELETKNGAILAENDSVSLLFPMGASQAEEVEARIVKWNVPPLVDRYKEACQDMGVELDRELSQILQEVSVIIDLSNKGFKGTVLAPLCKVLNRQTNLLELDLSGNFLTNECVQFLGNSMASLQNMYKLNLSCTGMSSEHLQLFANTLTDGASYKVADLDLSANMLSDQSLKSLATITRRFELKKLNLSCNQFTKDLFAYSFNRDVTLKLEQVEEFDVSDNNLSNEVVVDILSWLTPSNLKYLNVSRNGISHGFLKELLQRWGEVDELKLLTLKLSRCCVHDSDLFDLLRLASSLQNLDLSYNAELTSISLRRLLQADPLRNLELYGCNNIFKYFTELSKYLTQPSSEQYGGKSIKISVDLQTNYVEYEYLVDMWKELYGNKAVIEQGSRLLCLSVSNK